MLNTLRQGLVAAGLGLLLVAGLRGQITEMPTPVAPGKFLLEMDALTLTVDRDAGGRYTGVAAATTFLTTGLSTDWDLQVGAEFFLSQKYTQAGLSDRRSGIGDVYVRTKWRFYHDPETETACAAIPYVKIPTNTGGVGNHSLEGGVILPWTTTLPGGFSLAAMAEVDFLRNDNDDGYDTNWFGSASLSRHVTKALGLYAEVALGKSSGSSAAQGQFGAGVTLAVSERAWWDFALYKGISRGTPDWNHVIRFNFNL